MKRKSKVKPLRSKVPTVSLCMIVKDEEAYLRDCLQSVRDLVDEVIVVDTGSRDKTIAIAKEFGAQIVNYVWQDDFAAARNEAIKHAGSDWIFQLDADERLDADSIPDLKKWLKNKHHMCVSVLIDSPAAKQQKGHFSRAHRLFRNTKGIRYSGRIHEQISPSVKTLRGTEGFSDILIHHLGYAKDSDEMEAKSRRNRRLLRMQVEEQPGNGYWHFTLAQNLLIAGDFEEARACLKQALACRDLPADIVCSCYNNLAEIHMKLGRYEEAITFAEKALAITGEQTTAHLLLFQIYEKMDDQPRQIKALESALAITERTRRSVARISVEAYVEPMAILLNLGHKYREAGQFAPAKSAYEKVLRKQPDHASALMGLVDCHIALAAFCDARLILNRLLKLDGQNWDALEKLGWLHIKGKDFPKAIEIYERLVHRYPENEALIKRLAGLHKISGNTEKARTLLAAIMPGAAA